MHALSATYHINNTLRVRCFPSSGDKHPNLTALESHTLAGNYLGIGPCGKMMLASHENAYTSSSEHFCIIG